MATTIHHLYTPLSEQDVKKLHIGDIVYLSGQAFTCRSRLHRWVFDEGHAFPLEDCKRDVLIHVGPIVLKKQDRWQLISFMPTSSIRFEKWGAKTVENWGLRMIIGKTTMGDNTVAAMVKHKCVHVSPQCVSPNLWVNSINIDGVDLFEELGSIEATWHMNIDELGPFVVDIDCDGNRLYKNHEKDVDIHCESALEKLGIDKDFQYTKL